MKNHNNKNKSFAVKTFWQKILLDGEIFNIARKFRKKLGMPIDGFDYDQEWKKWRQKNIENDNTWETKRIKNINNFIKFIKIKYPHYKGILNDTNFSNILIEFYFFNNVSNDTLQEYLYSGFNLLILKREKKWPPSSLKIDDGVYIKITPSSSIDFIKKYIESHKSLIKDTQKLFIQKENIPIYKRLKSSKNFKRDDDIVFLNNLTKKEFEEFGCDGSYKEIQIAKMMKEKFGYKEVTTEIVKTVLQRRRRMNKARYGNISDKK